MKTPMYFVIFEENGYTIVLTMYQDSVILLQPSILVLRVCGLCPSALRRYRVPTSNKILAVVLILIPLFETPAILSDISSSYYDITAFIFYVNWIVGRILGNAYFLISPFLSCKTLSRFFMIMESAQKSLHSLNINQPPNPSKKKQILWLFILIGPTFITSIPYVEDRKVSRLPFLILFMVRVGTAFKIRVLLELVKGKFVLLNWHLNHLNNRKPLYLPKQPDESFGELTAVLECQEKMFVEDNLDNRSINPEKIRDFNKVHLKLFYAYKTLNSAFGTTAFVFIVVEGISFIADVYRSFIGYYSGKQTSSLIFLGVPIIYTHLYLAFTLFSLGTDIHEQSRKTALLVHHLLDEDRHSPQVQQELETFSMALLNRKAHFSAAGFFVMDLKLVSRIASFLAPIILFLVQNNNRPHSERRRPSP